MPTRVDDSHTLHSLYTHGHPLGVECRGCGRRGLALRQELETLRGNRQRLRTLKFVCSVCGSREWNGWMFVNRPDVLGFAGMLPGTAPLFY